MGKKIRGQNLNGISKTDIKAVEKFYNFRLDAEKIIDEDFALSLCDMSEKLGRIIGVLISREGCVEEVIVGDKNILYIPDLGRYRLSQGRLRKLRLVCTSFKREFEISSDYYTDLQKLRLDLVACIKKTDDRISMAFAHLIPFQNNVRGKIAFNDFSRTEKVWNIKEFNFDFVNFILDLENELEDKSKNNFEVQKDDGAILVGVYSKDYKKEDLSIGELKELVKTANIPVKDIIIQKRELDPKTVLGKGKLEEIMLRCLAVGADTIIFDRELKPSELREISNITKLKVLDRSMVILDIFAKRANSSDGRLQVELASLKYELPRILGRRGGLSRITGGVGSKGPGETKLELDKRRMNDRIKFLEKKLEKLSQDRKMKGNVRRKEATPLIAILGYTNAGKSTLFNMLTQGDVLVEDKLFATLDTTQRKLCLVGHKNKEKFIYCNTVISDTVGFIRDLPKELVSAFKATLDELYDARILLHVVDASDKNALEQYRSVVEILRDMDLGDITRIVVLNKCDLIEDNDDLIELEAEIKNTVRISAKTKYGFISLKKKILSNFHKGFEIYQ